MCHTLAATSLASNYRQMYHAGMGLLSFLKPKIAIATRTALINEIIASNRYQTYVEIGVRNPSDNLNKVAATTKFGVDPNPKHPVSHTMTSDEFFASWNVEELGTIDLIFIDGLHLAHQVEQDILNALDMLSPNGTVVLHDCNPLTEDAQTEEYGGKDIWNGTVWKAWIKFRATRPDLSMEVVDIDHGCGIIRRGTQQCIDLPTTDFKLMDYQLLNTRRTALLNLISVESFLASLRTDL